MAVPSFEAQAWTRWGTIVAVQSGQVRIAGICKHAGIGNEVEISTPHGVVGGEVLSVSEGIVLALLHEDSDAIRIGDRATILQDARISPGDHWLGKVINHRGETARPVHHAVLPVHRSRPLRSPPLPAPGRRGLGKRLSTGMMAFDTLLPLCRGQRIGLFAGSGVGKSSLLSQLACGLDADRVVIALIGERSREINDFVQRKLPEAVLQKCVIVAASASEPASAKKRAAYCAMATAEHFRDEGHHVLLVFDSITRFAEAHRETALTAGETPALNAFPPSTSRVISELAERSGPGCADLGDITAVYSVLVAGSDMDEPVADMIRGILDGHIVLSRAISERGRFPAIDVLKSVSRSLPDAADDAENELIRTYRARVSLYESVAPMLRANLFEFGRDAEADLAIAQYPRLDAFAAEPNPARTEAAFERLQALLAPDHEPGVQGPHT